MSGDERVEQISARLAAATPGPWHWRNTQEPLLQGARTYIVMAFRRMGMNGAQPLFRRDPHQAGLLDDAGKANLNDYPDAVLIANAPSDLAWLLAERKRLLDAVEAAERAGAVKALAAVETELYQRGDVEQAQTVNYHRYAIETGAPL